MAQRYRTLARTIQRIPVPNAIRFQAQQRSGRQTRKNVLYQSLIKNTKSYHEDDDDDYDSDSGMKGIQFQSCTKLLTVAPSISTSEKNAGTAADITIGEAFEIDVSRCLREKHGEEIITSMACHTFNSRTRQMEHITEIDVWNRDKRISYELKSGKFHPTFIDQLDKQLGYLSLSGCKQHYIVVTPAHHSEFIRMNMRMTRHGIPVTVIVFDQTIMDFV